MKIANSIASIVVLVLLSSCRQVYEVKVIQNSANPVFNFTEIQQEYRNKRLTIRELEVVNKNCQTDCVVWRIVGDEQASSVLEIIYGVVPDDMAEKIEHRELTDSKYEVGGHIWIWEGPKAAGTIMFTASFTKQP